MTVTAWPVVSRDSVVRAFRPGDPAVTEAPFRTLRTHGWATAGVRLSRRRGGRLAGQTTVFSSLNLLAAQFARHGLDQGAVQAAAAARSVEDSTEFQHLRGLLSDLLDDEVQDVLNGAVPSTASADLHEALRAVARRTEPHHPTGSAGSVPIDVVVGRIAEVHESFVVMHRADGQATAVPRWMATAARREEIGEVLMLYTDKIGPTSALVVATPALDLGTGTPPGAGDAVIEFDPFSRSDHRIHRLSEADARMLSERPEPLKILIPIAIDE